MHVDSSPAFRDPWFRTLVVLLTIIAAIYLGQTVWQLVAQVADLVILFVVAWLISFVLQPSVVALERVPRMTRTFAVLLVYLGLLLVLTAAAVVLVPEIATQSVLAAEQLPGLAEQIGQWGGGLAAFLASRGVVIGSYTDQLLRPLEAIGPTLVTNAFAIAGGVAAAVVQILLVIVVSLYLMLDGQRIGRYLLGAVPSRYRDDFSYFLSSVYRAFGGFLRGQIIQALVYGVGVALVMAVTGLPFVALTSVISGIAMFIPFLGPPLGMIPLLVVALATDAALLPFGSIRLLIALGLTVLLNMLVVNAVAPKVMSQQIGLHPVVVLAAFLIGARLAGPWGAVFSVPVAAVIVAMVSFYQLTHSERRERVLEVTGAPEETASVALLPPDTVGADPAPAR